MTKKRAKRIPIDKYREYADDVVAGRIVSCHYIFKACQRYLSWFERDDMYFDHESVDRVIAFMGKLKHFKGSVAGKPFILEKWQVWIVSWAFGFRWKHNKLRVVRNVQLQIPRKNGKDLALDTPIPTPNGWTTIGDLAVGDIVYDRYGKPTEVIDVTGIQHNRCYEVVFEDGERVIAGREHNWLIKDSYSGERIMQTYQLVNCSKKRADGKGMEHRYRVPMSRPVERDEKDLPIDPYMLGFWLGDGHKNSPRITVNGDDASEVLSYFTQEPSKVRKYKDENAYDVAFFGSESPILNNLRLMGLIGNKHIPDEYLNGSIQQRISLLQGLMDSDGYVSKSGYCEIQQKNNAVADGICEILGSLGIKYSRVSKIPTLCGKECDKVERINFYTDKSMPCFRLRRKYDRLKDRLNKRMEWKSIVSVKEVESVPTRCIQVSNTEGLFLFGKKYTVTHNSALCAALACYGLVADGEQGASVILAANSANQAHMIFEFCQKFLDPYGKIFQRYRDSIKFPATNSTLQIVSTNTKAIEGENASMYIIDEIELAENSKMYDTLSTSTVARTQPMGWIIGTAGFDTDSFCYSMIQVQKDILDGNTQDDSSIGIFYEVDEGDDPFNDDEQRTILRKTNPNLGVTCQIDAIEGEKRKAGNNPRLKASVLMRHFDLWTNSLEEWIPEPIIVKNLYNINLDDYADRTMYLGIDLSAAKDLTCISVCVHDEDRDEYIWKNWYWVSQEQATKSKKRQEYQMWIKQGYVTVCPGHTIDYEMMYDKVNELCSKYYVAYIGYDPYNATLLSRKLENEGRPMIPYGMSLPNMNRPMKEFEIAILNDRVRIDNNPLNKWCLGNTSPKVDIHENIYPVKTNVENKIDGTVAMLISYGVCLQNEYPIAMGAVLS